MSSISSNFLIAAPDCGAVWLTDCLSIATALLPTEAVILPFIGAAAAWETCRGKVLSLAWEMKSSKSSILELYGPDIPAARYTEGI